MSLIYLPDSFRFHTFGGTIECTRCGEEKEACFTTDSLDADELLYCVFDSAGLDQNGHCPTCAREQAAEDAADADMRDRKAGLEGMA